MSIEVNNDQHREAIWKIAYDGVKSLEEKWPDMCKPEKILKIAKECLSVDQFENNEERRRKVIGYVYYVLTKDAKDDISKKISEYQSTIQLREGCKISWYFFSSRYYASKAMDKIENKLIEEIGSIPSLQQLLEEEGGGCHIA
jgi:hypothetical protein